MRTDIWPAPAPESEVLDWVRRRAVRIRVRRRLAKAVPAVATAVVLAVALANGGGTASVSTVDETRPADAPGTEHAAKNPDADDDPGSSETTTTTSPVRVDVRPPERAYAPVVGNVPVAPVAPVYATSHPLLTDPEGDAYGFSSSAASNPTLDILTMDVTADATSVTTTLHILDIDGEPRSSVGDRKPTVHSYGTVLIRDDGYYSLWVHRDLQTGAVTARGTFWYAVANAGYSGAWNGSDFAARGTVDEQTGVATIAADFADMNQAMQADSSQPHPAIGLGTGVRLQGRTESSGSLANYREGPDNVVSADPGYTYRLGD